MRTRLNFYPFLRRQFTDMEEVANVLNRSRRYVQNIFNGKKEFTKKERDLIVNYLKPTEEELKYLFTKEI